MFTQIYKGFDEYNKNNYYNNNILHAITIRRELINDYDGSIFLQSLVLDGNVELLFSENNNGETPIVYHKNKSIYMKGFLSCEREILKIFDERIFICNSEYVSSLHVIYEHNRELFDNIILRKYTLNINTLIKIRSKK